jgi:hypothetical protein
VPWLYAAWLLATLAWPIPRVRWRRATVAVALLATVVAAGMSVGPPWTVLATLALLGVVALLGPAGRAMYPMPVALATLAAAAVVASYDNGWRVTGWRDFPHTASLVVTLATAAFALAVLAGVRALRASGHRYRAAAALLAGAGWLGALALPHLPAWGPILFLVPLAAMAIAGLRLVRTWRARVDTHRGVVQGRHWALLTLAEQLAGDPVAGWSLASGVLVDGYRHRRTDDARLSRHLVRAALHLPPRMDAGDPLSTAVAALPPAQRVALILCYAAELPLWQAADLLDLTPPAVAALTTDALAKLMAHTELAVSAGPTTLTRPAAPADPATLLAHASPAVSPGDTGAGRMTAR